MPWLRFLFVAIIIQDYCGRAFFRWSDDYVIPCDKLLQWFPLLTLCISFLWRCHRPHNTSNLSSGNLHGNLILAPALQAQCLQELQSCLHAADWVGAKCNPFSNALFRVRQLLGMLITHRLLSAMSLLFRSTCQDSVTLVVLHDLMNLSFCVCFKRQNIFTAFLWIIDLGLSKRSLLMCLLRPISFHTISLFNSSFFLIDNHKRSLTNALSAFLAIHSPKCWWDFSHDNFLEQHQNFYNAGWRLHGSLYGQDWVHTIHNNEQTKQLIRQVSRLSILLTEDHWNLHTHILSFSRLYQPNEEPHTGFESSWFYINFFSPEQWLWWKRPLM